MWIGTAATIPSGFSSLSFFCPAHHVDIKVVVVLVGGVLDAEAVNLSHFYRMGVGDAVGGDALLDFSALGDFDG